MFVRLCQKTFSPPLAAAAAGDDDDDDDDDDLERENKEERGKAQRPGPFHRIAIRLARCDDFVKV